jgi:hypothetical protein
VRDVVNVRRRQQVPVGPDAPLIEVTDAMVQSGDPAVPVVEGDVIAGVVTVDDLLPALCRSSLRSPAAGLIPRSSWTPRCWGWPLSSLSLLLLPRWREVSSEPWGWGSRGAWRLVWG